MQYELAKELKDAGFPQLDYSCILQDLEDVAIQDKNDSSVWYYKPTLSELIEACGENFELTDCFGVLRDVESNKLWLARKHYGIEKPPELGDGATPEEAVAKLWLALNKK